MRGPVPAAYIAGLAAEGQPCGRRGNRGDSTGARQRVPAVQIIKGTKQRRDKESTGLAPVLFFLGMLAVNRVRRVAAAS